MKRITWLGLCLFLAFILAGCGTIKGVGEDISTIGRWITRGSDNVRENVGKK